MTLLLQLFTSVFSHGVCQVNAVQIKDATYQEIILQEFKIKKRAISCLRAFLIETKALLSKKHQKFAAHFAMNAIGFFFPSSEKKEIEKLLKYCFKTDLLQAQADLYDCLSMLPPVLFQAKFVTLLHPVCEVIIVEDGGLFGHPPGISRELLNS